MPGKNDDLPKIIESFTIGNRGESFLEFMMSKHALMHKVVGYKDIGLDYLCEWITEGSPTRVLFGIQVKTSDKSNIQLDHIGRNKGMNGLEIYKFNKKIPSWDITHKTINYWFGFEIPLYVFFVLKDKQDFDCYYRRLTPILHKKDKEAAIREIQTYMDCEMYKANNGSDFIAVLKRGRQDGGFARDLFFDSVRCSYLTGSIRHRKASEFGLKGWDGRGVYADILGEEGCPYMDNLGESLPLLQSMGVVDIRRDWRKTIMELKNKLHKKQ